MKSKILLFLFTVFTTLGYAQLLEIKGTVKDANLGVTMPGVNVIVKNSQISASTDFEGNFQLSNVPKGSTLVFTFIGYNTIEKVVQKSDILIVSLKEDTKNLEEVVIVGYTTKKKTDVTGSVSVVSSKTIEDLHVVNAVQGLQGTTPGVVVNTGSGAPGSGFSINIRGISSNTNNQPYVLIDGFEGDFSLLNPADIESITILKDAQASVYGSKGANGVVIVTTKLGKKNSKAKVSFNSYFGTQETTKKLNLLNATEYALLLNESYANNGQAVPYPNVSGLGKGTDWQDEVLKKAAIKSNDFSISGGSDKIIYSFSGSKVAQEGIVGLEKSGFDRSTARVSIGVDLSDKFNLTTNLNYLDYNRQGLNENGIGSVLFNAINTPATLSPYTTNGDYTLIPDTPGFGNEVINPLAQIENTYNRYNQKKISGNIVLKYKPLKEFTITSRYGFNSANSTGKSFSKRINYGNSKVFNVNNNSVSQNTQRFSDFTFDLFGEYEKTYFEKHTFKLTLGGTLVESKGEGLYATGYNVPYNSWEFADIALAGPRTVTDLEIDPNSPLVAGVVNGSYKSTPYKRPSIFTTLDYNFKEKYLVTFILRRDQSSLFPKSNSVAYFKSILGGWIISKEDFFNKNGAINFLKLRGSYGTLGNDVAGSFRSTLSGEATYVFNGSLSTGVATGTIPNTKITWESDTKIDIGFDMNMFRNKIEINADFFNNTRTDLIVSGVPISGINGQYAPGSGAPIVNAGKVSNQGFELAVNYKNSDNPLKYQLGFNVTTLKNKVLEVKNSTGFIESGSFAIGQLSPTRMEVGQPIGVFYGLKTAGIFQNQAEIDDAPVQNLGTSTSPGDIRFVDVNNDGVVDFKDRTYIGSQIADYTLGFNINLTYKGFEFLAYSYASIGNDLIRNYERTENKLNKLNYVLDRWTGEGTSNTVPRVTTGASSNNLFSDYFVEDASYLRIQNAQFGYSIPEKFIENTGFSKIKFYVSVNNIYTFTKYKGFDATTNNGNPISGGIDYGSYPQPRIYSFGVNVNF